jgi:LAGLIDADG endonuclease
MKSLISTLGCGIIELNLARSNVNFLVTKYTDISEKVKPFFDKYPFKGAKVSDYNYFKQVSILMSKKAHLTEQGISKFQSIKSEMNFIRRSV